MRFVLIVLCFFAIINTHSFATCVEKGDIKSSKLKESEWIASMEFKCHKLKSYFFHHSKAVKKTTYYKIESKYLKGSMKVLFLHNDIKDEPKDEEVISVLVYNYFVHSKNGKEMPPIYIKFKNWIGEDNCKKFKNMVFDVFRKIGVD